MVFREFPQQVLRNDEPVRQCGRATHQLPGLCPRPFIRFRRFGPAGERSCRNVAPASSADQPCAWLPRRRLVQLAEIPEWSAVYRKFALVSFWVGTAIAVFAVLVAWFRVPPTALRLPLAVAAALLVGVAIAVSVRVTNKLHAKDPRGMEALFGPEATWPFYLLFGDPVVSFFAALALLLYVVVSFVLFAVWLPGLLFVLSALTLGDLWRSYRTVLLEVPEGGIRNLRLAGRDLVARGAVLSKSWDVYLDPRDARLAGTLREIHARIHLGVVLLGGFALALTVAAILRGFLPTADSFMVLAGSAGAAVVSLGFLGESLARRRRIRNLASS